MELRGDDFLDVALGGTILGTGGGGSFAAARVIAEGSFARRRIRLVAPEDVPARARVVSAAAMGSPEAMLHRGFTTQARNAIEALEPALPGPVQYVVPIETSGYNHLACMTACIGRQIAVVDADGAGRAIPRLGHTLFHLAGVPFSPYALANAPGRTVTVTTTDFSLEERMALNALEYFGWLAGLAAFPMTGETMRHAGVPGMVSLARKVGAAVRKTRGARDDPLGTVLEVCGGVPLIRGKIVGFHTETDGSYTFGNLKVKGVGEDTGSLVAVKSMNENMIAWRDGKLVAVAPDRICYLRPDGQPVTNADVVVGEPIDIFVIEAQKQWRNPGSLAAFSDTLRAMGFSGPYVRGPLLDTPHR